MFDLLSPCSGLLKHAAATTPAAVIVLPLTFNALQSCRHRVGPCAVHAAQVAVAETAPCRGVRHRRRPKPRSPPLAVLLRLPRAMPRPPYSRDLIVVGLDDSHVARIDVHD
jgi:hypothetical protein